MRKSVLGAYLPLANPATATAHSATPHKSAAIDILPSSHSVFVAQI